MNYPINAIVLGANGRGRLYGDYAMQHPGLLKIVAVAEPVDIRNKQYADRYHIPEKYRFKNWTDVFDRPKFADAVIISTPDHLHYQPCVKALETGYDILLEKPIAQTEDECRKLVEIAGRNKRIVGVTHVLRYSPYFLKIKDLVSNGHIGELVSIQHFEPVEYKHMAHSYVRGSWHNSRTSTPLVLAKSSHDLDILHWLIDSPCTDIKAYGDLRWFRKENAPAGAPDRCTDNCPAEAECPYSALRIYQHNREWTYVFDLPENPEEHGDFILQQLKTTNYGKCVYHCDNDQPDHYVMSMEFANKVTVNFSIEAFTSYGGRRTRIMGTMGDIAGDMETLSCTDFRTGKTNVWNIESLDAGDYKNVGHGGGDYGLIESWINAVYHQDPSLIRTSLNESLPSHMMAFAAERSRNERRNISITI